jgi:iron(III) transport system ATP-binding protein
MSGTAENGGTHHGRAASLEARGIGRRFGERAVLQDVDLDVAPGEIAALLGPSGCGKSTLLRIIAGVDAQTSGTLRLDGALIAGPDVFVPPERRSVGLIFQDYALFPHMTNLANVTFGLRRVPKAEAAGIGLAMLARVGLGHYADAYPGMLSGGEQQRVALARALAPRPRVLLMDEPFSGLDRRLRDSVREETLAVLQETSISCVFVTHDPEEAMRLADRIVLMRRGRVVQAGSAHELYTRPVDIETARFFSEINEIDALVGGGTAETAIGPFPAAGIGDGRAIVALRPQALSLAAADGAGFSARIREQRFLGELQAVEVAADGLDQPLRLRLPPGTIPAVGSRVRVTVDPAGVLVFAGTGP